jgi:hypothetical protein
MKVEGNKTINWFLDLTTSDTAVLPFLQISPTRIDCQFEGLNYSITTSGGSFSKPNDSTVFRITPANNSCVIVF